jgi:hypothetical protein
MLPGGKIGQAGTRPYYEVCVSPKVLELADLLAESVEKRPRENGRLKRVK